MIAFLKEQSRRAGVHRARFVHWTKKKYGPLVIKRVRRDGQMGTSLPCIVCRKVLDRLHMPWVAHIDTQWVKSTDQNVPKSKPTHKQKTLWEKKRVFHMSKGSAHV